MKTSVAVFSGTLCIGTGLAALPAHSQDVAGQPVALEQVVVTATKQAENLQDVAVAVSAVTEDSIDKRGFTGMGDYLTKLPAVTIQDRGPGRNQIVIRGVASKAGGFAESTVGIYIGDMPLSAGVAFGNNGFPDLKLYDVSRIEVLRGPQGTLYGSGSMGGTVKIIPTDPVMNQFEGKTDVTLSHTQYGGMNYDVGTALNLPLVDDRLALRLVGYRKHQDGFIDDNYPGNDFSTPQAALGGFSLQDFGVPDPGIAPRKKSNVNDVLTNGARIAATLAVSDDLDVTLSYLHQKSEAGGLPEVDASTGSDFTQSRFLKEDLEDEFNLYNLVVSYSGPWFDFTSSTGYMDRKLVQSRDVSSFFLTGPLQLTDKNDTKNFSQEVRFSSADEGSFNWLVGAFFQRLDGTGRQKFQWRGNQASLTGFMDNVIFGTTTGLTLDSDLYTRDDRSKEKQYALFGEASYDISERWRATLGGRWFKYDQDFDGFQDGAFVGGTPLGGSPLTSKLSNQETGLNPKVGLEFRPEVDQLYYVKASKGFRLGSPQAGVPDSAPGCGAELTSLGVSAADTRKGLKSDELWSYEAGGKLTLADGRVTVNGATYYINWRDIPVEYQLACGFNFSANAGKATSKGVEVEVNAALTQGLVLMVSGSFVDSTLAEDMPASTGISGKKGDRLPGIPRWNFQTGLQYDFEVFERETFLRADYTYVGAFFNKFPDDAGYARSGDYGLVDLRAGIKLSELVSLEAFAQNVTNKTVNLLVDTEVGDGRYVVGTPRTLGVTLRLRY